MGDDILVNKNVINNKLKELNKNLKQLHNYQGINTKQLHNNMGKLWAIERGLQLSIQIILDIGNHILADKGITVENYADIFQELINQEIIPEQYGKKIKDMAGFRNILVHEYAEVDLNVIIEVLENSLDDFEKFAFYINRYLENEDIKN